MQWQQHWQLGPTEKFWGSYALFLWCMSTYTSETGWSLSVVCQHTLLELFWSVSVAYVPMHFWKPYGLLLWHMSTQSSDNNMVRFCGICQHTLLKIVWSVSVGHVSKYISGALMVSFYGICQHTLLKLVSPVPVACQHTLLEMLQSVSVKYINISFWSCYNLIL